MFCSSTWNQPAVLIISNYFTDNEQGSALTKHNLVGSLHSPYLYSSIMVIVIIDN